MYHYKNKDIVLTFERKLNLLELPRQIAMGKTSKFLVAEDPIHRHDGGLNQGEPIDDASSEEKDTFNIGLAIRNFVSSYE